MCNGHGHDRPTPPASPAPSGYYHTIAEECFTNGDVISYKGANYFKACDYNVTGEPNAEQTFCVKRVGHPGFVHEDYHGATVISDELA